MMHYCCIMQLCTNAMQILRVGTPFGRTGVRRGSATLDTVLVSSCRLLIVTMSLSEAVWLQFAMQVFGCVVSPPISGEWGIVVVRIFTAA